ncbi:MAG: PAS domain S-box protein [Chloroflexi bacterium]|nr:PAS domain S-box protein [Chloroflexota bacterium]
MSDNKDAVQLQIKRLRRIRWIVLFVTYVLIVLVVAMNHFGPFASGAPLWKGAVNLLFAWAVAFMMIRFIYKHAQSLLEQLYQMTVQQEAVEVWLGVQSAALEAAANAIMMTDGNGRVTWVNRAFTKLTGYTSEEALDQNPSLLRSGKHAPSFYKNLWDTIRVGRVWQGEITNRRKDGSLYAEEQTITPVLDESGQISHFIAIKQDITRRKQIEKMEQERRERAEALRETGLSLNASLDLEIVLDHLLEQIGRILPYDAANLMIIENGKVRIARKIGYDQINSEIDWATNDLWFDLAETANLQLVVSSRQPVIVSNIADYPEWVSLGPSSFIQSWASAPIIVQDKVVALFSLDKKEPGFYQPEHARLLETFAAQASLAWHNAYLFEEVNRRAQEIQLINRIIMRTAAAQSKVEILQIGCTEIADFFSVPQAVAILRNDAATNVEIVAEYMATGMSSLLGAIISTENNPILLAFFGDNNPLPISDIRLLPLPPEMAAITTQRGIVSVLMVPLFVQDQAVGAIGIHSKEQRDFSPAEIDLALIIGETLGQAMELASLNEKLRIYAAKLEDRVRERTRELAEANTQLQALDRLKSKFVSDVSHELRTPITNLGLYMDLLEHGRSDKTAHYVDILQKEIARIRQLVEDILDLSRLETSWANSVSFEPIDLNQIVEEAVTAQLPNAKMVGLQMSFEPALELPMIMGEPQQLAQVATNLVANAINYTSEGEIKVATYQKKGEICLEVRDTGMGIDPEDIPYLFDRFYRGQRVAQLGTPGTGLGLGIVKEIMDLHGGRVEAVSELGQGAIFRMWLTAIAKSA